MFLFVFIPLHSRLASSYCHSFLLYPSTYIIPIGSVGQRSYLAFLHLCCVNLLCLWVSLPPGLVGRLASSSHKSVHAKLMIMFMNYVHVHS